jgi:acetyl-CoA C-acetyltransferase
LTPDRDPRLPVVVGVSQIEQRVEDPRKGAEPLEMMIAAVERAADDAGSRDLLRAANSVRVIRGMWGYGDPGRAVAKRIGAPHAQTVGTPWGGNAVQSTVNKTALAIQRGELDVVVITGAEVGYSSARARKQGVELTFTEAPGRPDLLIAPEEPMSHQAEIARDIVRAIQIYPIFENAIRYARGESLEAHRVRVSELWARFNAVAVGNPHAWLREPLSAEEIRTVSPSNRMVGFPYPKLMNANNRVDQGGALILCSAAAARRAGIGEERWVYLHACTEAHDSATMSTRADLHSSPAIRIAGARVLELAKTSIEELAQVDLYSCFPSAGQIPAQELGIDEKRQLTVTGGLTFGGGPLNDYVMHSNATMVELLRADPGSKGLVTAVGGYLAKHAFGVYSTEPSDGPFQYESFEHLTETLPHREVSIDHRGPAAIESYTVMHGVEGPEIGHAACLLADGRRTWANTRDANALQEMISEECCGRPVEIDGKGNFTLR